MNILVTGANGQLGNEMRIVAKESKDKYIFTDVVEVEGQETTILDITDLTAIKSVVKANGNCLDSLAYGHRSEDLKELADITIDLKQPDKKTACAKILEKLGGIL